MSQPSFTGQFQDETLADVGATPARVRVRTVALPVEHGGWGLSLEPVALGLLVAPSVAGVFLAIATMGAFLARHPFKLIVADRRRGRRFPRTAVAERFALLYTVIAITGLLAATATAVDDTFLLPLLAASPFAAVQLAFDGTGRSRALAPELAGSFAMAAVSTSIALADGWPLPTALALWAVLGARVVPTILYVRARLKQLHGETPAATPVVVTHTAALILVLLLAWLKVAPLLAALALLVLLVRAVTGFFIPQPSVTAKQIGVRELGYGVITVLAVVAGRLLGW